MWGGVREGDRRQRSSGLREKVLTHLPGASDPSRRLRALCENEVMSEQRTQLIRPREDRVIAGVAAGLADRFGISRTLMRVIFVVSMLLPGPQILIYLILWIVMPEGD